MSGNHKRKRRDEKRSRRYRSTLNFVEFLELLNFKTAKNKIHRGFSPIRKVHDFVCRFDKL